MSSLALINAEAEALCEAGDMEEAARRWLELADLHIARSGDDPTHIPAAGTRCILAAGALLSADLLADAQDVAKLGVAFLDATSYRNPWRARAHLTLARANRSLGQHRAATTVATTAAIAYAIALDLPACNEALVFARDSSRALAVDHVLADLAAAVNFTTGAATGATSATFTDGAASELPWWQLGGRLRLGTEILAGHQLLDFEVRTVQERIGTELTSGLSRDQLDAYARVEDDDDAATTWIRTHIPDHMAAVHFHLNTVVACVVLGLPDAAVAFEPNLEGSLPQSLRVHARSLARTRGETDRSGSTPTTTERS